MDPISCNHLRANEISLDCDQQRAEPVAITSGEVQLGES